MLSMLWESVDAADALSERFGFNDALSVVDWISDTLWDTWATPVDQCDRIVMSDRNLLAWMTTGRGRVIAKWSTSPELFQRLADTTKLTMWLHGRGVPVAAPIPAKDGRLRVQLGDISLGVFPVVDGDLLDVDDLAQVVQAGHLLATLHEELAVYSHPIDGGKPVGHEQLVQNDFRSANILHDGTSITAVLDFDDASYRTRVADLAQATVLLSTRYHNWCPTSPFIREAFVAAYQDYIPLTDPEQHELRRQVAAVSKRFGWE